MPLPKRQKASLALKGVGRVKGIQAQISKPPANLTVFVCANIQLIPISFIVYQGLKSETYVKYRAAVFLDPAV